MKIAFALCMMLVLAPNHLQANNLHTLPPKRYLIIDTDGAADDLRAISMLLADNNNQVLGIIGSRGSVSAYSSANKVFCMLEEYGHGGIPVGIGNEIAFNLPYWQGSSDSILWGKNCSIQQNFRTSAELINQILENNSVPITLVALGSLNTYAEWLKTNATQKSRIEKIIWYGSFEDETDFNRSVDVQAAEQIKNSGLPIECVRNTVNFYPVNQKFIIALQAANSQYAKNIIGSHSAPILKDHIANDSLHLWDDFIALYFYVPILFKKTENGNISEVRMDAQLPQEFFYNIISELLTTDSLEFSNVFSPQKNQLLPYTPDLEKYRSKIITKYGVREWETTIQYLSWQNTIHLEAVLGLKMLQLVQQYFDAPAASFNVQFSGMNNRHFMQSALFANNSLCTNFSGIESSPNTIPYSIIVTYNGQKIRIWAKEYIVKEIDSISREIEKELNPGKREQNCRSIFLQKCIHWDKNQIFVIETLF